jgi:hypothetical protein
MAKALGEPHLLRSGGSVAVSSVFLAAFLGATRIALIGQDLAFTDGRRYAEGTVYDALRVETEADGQVFFTNLKVKGDFFERPTPDREAAPGALWVEGWDGEPVLTDRSYASFLNEYESVARLLGEEGVRLENCTEGGARIPGLNHLPLADFLEAAPRRPLPADQRIEATRGAANPGDAAKLIREARDLEQATRALLKDARQGLERVARLEAAGPAGDTGALRRLQSAETKVRQQLERLPGIAAMMQHELHELSLASLRRGAADSGGPLARSRGLLEAAERSGEGLLELLRRLCQGVEENGLAEGDSAAGTG